MNTNEVFVSRQKRNLGHNNAASLVKKAVFMALEHENMNNCIVSCMLTDDDGIQKLNKEFRGVDSPTDVLSFPMNEKDIESDKTLLGDMMININRCEQQGEEFGHGFDREIMYLAVHSVLHLLGYDHVDEDKMKAEMRRHEKEIMGDD